MKEFLATIVRELVSEPEEIRIKESKQGGSILLEISVAPQDMGKVIGRGGKRAQAIRSIMKAKATREGTRVIVDIID